MRRPDRENAFDQQEERRADKRPQKCAGAAKQYNNHGEPGGLVGERVDRNDREMQCVQRAREAAHCARKREGCELDPFHVIAAGRGPRFVFADRFKRRAERRIEQPRDRPKRRHDEAEDDVKFDHGVEEIQRQRADLQAAHRQTAQAVFPPPVQLDA